MTGNAIKLPPTWRDLYASGQKLLREGEDVADVPGRLGIRGDRWRESCGACSLRVVTLVVEEREYRWSIDLPISDLA